MKQPKPQTALMFVPSICFGVRNRKLAVKVIILFVTLSPLSAQAQTGSKSTKPSTEKISGAAGEPSTENTNRIEKSRYVRDEQMTDYLSELSAVLTASKRTIDPFGQSQDPDAKPIIRTPVAMPNRVAPVQATPFSDIIRLIKVTTVMPSERKFLIGTRSLKVGDRLPLTYRGRELNVEIASVSSRAIQFRNIENGETADLTLDLLPPGMTPGTSGIKAFGMIPDRPDAPLDLDNNSDSTDASRSR